MTIDLTKKTLDKVIAEQFPEYSFKAKEIAWSAIYENTKEKEFPTTGDIRIQKSGAMKMKLTLNESSGAETLLGIFDLEKGKDGSLLIYKNDLEAPTDNYWELVGEFKPY
jgi:hypothetical protein